MYPEASAVYGPGLELLRVLNQGSAGALAGTLAGARGAFEESVADIAKAQEKKGVDFKGFTGDEYGRFFGANALPAISGLESTVGGTNLQLANVLNQLEANRGQTAMEFGDKRAGRELEAGLKREEMSLEERLANQKLSAQVEADRIAAARAAAKASAKTPSESEQAEYWFDVLDQEQRDAGGSHQAPVISYGAAAEMLARAGVDIRRGKPADIALRQYYGFAGR